jgi:pimeloyl-ACP methyl ester carboxylesterase
MRRGDERPSLPPGRFVWLPGRGRTFVREVEGPPGAPVLMLLHGWTATADLNWHACFESLARHFRVIALDHRGHGRGLRTDGPFRLRLCADDVAALARELGIERFIAVGYSMGGPVAKLLWLRHREMVDGLVLCATSCTFTGRARERFLFAVAAGTSAINGGVPLGRLAGATLGAWHRRRRRRGAEWWGYQQVVRHDWSAIIEAGREIGRFDSRRWIRHIGVSTAVVVTDDDDVVPAGRQLAMAARIPHASVHRVAGGHAVCTLEPDRFVPQLVEACLSVARRPARGAVPRRPPTPILTATGVSGSAASDPPRTERAA